MSSYPTEKPLSPRFLNGTIAKGKNPRATLGAMSQGSSRFAADLLYQVSIIDGATISCQVKRVDDNGREVILLLLLRLVLPRRITLAYATRQNRQQRRPASNTPSTPLRHRRARGRLAASSQRRVPLVGATTLSHQLNPGDNNG